MQRGFNVLDGNRLEGFLLEVEGDRKGWSGARGSSSGIHGDGDHERVVARMDLVEFQRTWRRMSLSTYSYTHSPKFVTQPQV